MRLKNVLFLTFSLQFLRSSGYQSSKCWLSVLSPERDFLLHVECGLFLKISVGQGYVCPLCRATNSLDPGSMVPVDRWRETSAADIREASEDSEGRSLWWIK